VAGRITARPQPAEGLSHAPKIKKRDGAINWTQPARANWNRVRGLIPWPGAFTTLGKEKSLLKIWRAQVVVAPGAPGEILQADKTGLLVGCGRDSLRILTVQREGGRRLSAQEFLTGHPLKPSEHLG
jgi:methionyl-tRNA formyltransferase